MSAVAIIDIGASSLKLGLSEEGALRRVAVIAHEAPAPEALADQAASALAGEFFSAARLCAPGPVRGGTLLRSDGLGWSSVALGRVFGAALGVAVEAVMSDAAAARRCAARELGPIEGAWIALVVGTGVGGAVVGPGGVLRAEGLGHVAVAGGARCGRCGGARCLEAAASAPGVLRALGASGDLAAVDRRAAAGDAAAAEALRRQGRLLARGAEAWAAELGLASAALWLGGGPSGSSFVARGCVEAYGLGPVAISAFGRWAPAAGLVGT